MIENKIEVIRKKIGENIQLIREKRNMKQEKLGSLINKTQGVISYWEKGRKHISASQLFELANVLGCDVKDFYQGSGYIDRLELQSYASKKTFDYLSEQDLLKKIRGEDIVSIIHSVCDEALIAITQEEKSIEEAVTLQSIRLATSVVEKLTS